MSDIVKKLAAAWASMDGKYDEFYEGQFNGDDAGHYEGYMSDARELIDRSGIDIGDVSYEIVTDEGEWCAESTSLTDAQHYAMVYSPAHIVEVRRRKI